MKKMICKVCKKEYYRTEQEAEKDSGCCSPLCETRDLLNACRRQETDGQTAGKED